MSTRALIGVLNEDDKVTFIYSHWDGYIEHVGTILAKHYRNIEKVQALMNEGDVSTLGESIGVKHDFANYTRGQCNFYGRDRGETDIEAKTASSVATFKDEMGHWNAEYLYLYKSAKWLVYAPEFGSEFIPVVKAIKLYGEKAS